MTLPAEARDPGRRAVYLHAGRVHVAAEPTAVTTILGSCVAACLFDRVAGVGGVNHYLLPIPTRRDSSAEFGEHAMRELLERTLAAGARRDALEAKVFGGACVVRALRGRDLGAENAELALRFLEGERIPVTHRDVGGDRGRKLVFLTDDGSAWVRHL